MAKLVRETSEALRVIVAGAYVVALVFCGAGIWLVYLGTAGASEMSFFGAHLKSTNAGISALFLGACTVVLLIRSSLRTLYTAVRTESPDKAGDSVPAGAWPATKTFVALKQKVYVLSEEQWQILQAVAQLEGATMHSLEARFGMGSSVFNHRVRSLALDELITFGNGNVYLSPTLKKALGKRQLRDLRP